VAENKQGIVAFSFARSDPNRFYLWDMATTCNRNEQQQDAKNNVELQTEWTKTTWKTFEQTIRRGQGVTLDG
jgi:hypothetical protein